PAQLNGFGHPSMTGGPSQVHTCDPKPMLDKYHGRALPRTNLRTERKTGAAMRSPFAFKPYGNSGIPVSELFARTAAHIDDIAVIRSMHADVPNHEPSLMLMNCGDGRLPRPSMGAWVTYGLGSANQNLPGFLALCPGGYPIVATQNWRSAFLPPPSPPTSLTPPPPRRPTADRAPHRPAGPAARAAPAARPGAAPHPPAQRPAAARRPARGPHPVVRAGLPHAERGDPRLRRQPRAGQGARGLRPRRPRPPAAHHAAAAGARRPLHPGLERRRPAVGQPRRPGEAAPQPGAAVGPTHRRLPARPQAARPAGNHPGDVGRRVWPHARGRVAGPERPRPQPLRLHDVAGRRRRARRPRPRGHRRVRLPRRRGPRPRPRPARHRPAPAWLRPREADLPLRRPRLPPHRR